jgi:hypothetical protein
MFFVVFGDMMPASQLCFHHQLKLYFKDQRYADIANHMYICLRIQRPGLMMRDIPMSLLNPTKESSPENPNVGMAILNEMNNLIAAGGQWDGHAEMIVPVVDA